MEKISNYKKAIEYFNNNKYLEDRIQVRVLRQLRLAARKKFLDEGLLAEADREFLARIQAIAAQADCALVIQNPKAP
jgi:hypothetical protein